MINTSIMLPTTIYGQASGNYDGSSLDWAGVPVQAADYYRGRGGIQTITIQTTGFVGKMYIEACLDTLQDSAAWFTTYELGDGVNPVTDMIPETILGNFVWMRVRVESFTAGIIDSVTITY